MTFPNHICSIDEMRVLEQCALTGGSSQRTLMRKAGEEVSKKIVASHNSIIGAHVLVLIGSGNNGGDGIVIAHQLAKAGAQVTVLMAKPRNGSANVICKLPASVQTVTHSTGRAGHLAKEADIIVDCLLGIGATIPIRDPFREILEELLPAKAFRISCDIPSGLDANTGKVDPLAFKADLTISTGPLKLGSLMYPGRQYCGKLIQTDIGIPENALDLLPGRQITSQSVAEILPERTLEGHKGSYGKTLVIAGSRNFPGAATLACLGALRSGVGYAKLASIKSVVLAAAAHSPDIIFELLSEFEGTISPSCAKDIIQLSMLANSLIVGPGLGNTENTNALVKTLLSSPNIRCPIVLDADGLSSIDKSLFDSINRNRPLLLTPHPGEMAKIMETDLRTIGDNRLKFAQSLATRSSSVTVLKGAGTIVAHPNNNYAIVSEPSPALAVAGSGDVLSGIIGAMLAQQISPFKAAIAGVYLHVQCGIKLGRNLGLAGVIASDLPAQIPLVIKALSSHHSATS